MTGSQPSLKPITWGYDKACGYDESCLMVKRGRDVIGAVHGELADLIYQAIQRTPLPCAQDVVERQAPGVWMMKGRECQSVAREIVEDVMAALDIPLHDFRKRDEAIMGCRDTVQKVMDAAAALQSHSMEQLVEMLHSIIKDSLDEAYGAGLDFRLRYRLREGLTAIEDYRTHPGTPPPQLSDLTHLVEQAILDKHGYATHDSWWKVANTAVRALADAGALRGMK